MAIGRAPAQTVFKGNIKARKQKESVERAKHKKKIECTCTPDVEIYANGTVYIHQAGCKPNV